MPKLIHIQAIIPCCGKWFAVSLILWAISLDRQGLEEIKRSLETKVELIAEDPHRAKAGKMIEGLHRTCNSNR